MAPSSVRAGSRLRRDPIPAVPAPIGEQPFDGGETNGLFSTSKYVVKGSNSMRPTIRLGKISGIDIGLHWTIGLIAFILVTSLTGTILPAWAPGYAGPGYLLAALVTAVLFLGSIVAHELGHSIVAERNDVKVKGITLFGLGGVAALERDPDTPGAAARIAAAGPAVSVVVGALALILAGSLGVLGAPTLVTVSFAWLGIINLALAVFNMVPALPLDGGRVLQAALWRRGGERFRATIKAATWGRWIGWAIVAVGLWQFLTVGTGLWTALIGWFIASSAKAEGMRARFELWRQQMAEQGGVQPPFAAWMRGFGQPFPGAGPGHGDQFDGVDSRPPGSAPHSGGTVIEVEGRPVEPEGDSVDEQRE